MKLGQSLLIGVLTSVWTGIVGLLVVPLYLKYLGIANYGLIGFFATTQALLQLLDMGLAPAVNRELARCSASGRMGEARSLLHTLAIVYWSTAIFVGLLITLLAPYIADHWLQSKDIEPKRLASAITLMGFVVACRWPVGLYQGALMGMQRLAISSSISAIMLTVGNFGAVAILAWISPTVEAFFVWQAGIALTQVMIMRRAAWRVVGRDADPSRFNAALLRRIWRFSAGMSGIAISSILLTQLDKVLLSKLLSLDDFGRYTLAGVLASGLYLFLTPVFNVVYPRMAALVVHGDTSKLLHLYKSGTRMLASVLLPIATSAALYSQDLVHLWTGNPELAISVAPIVSLLIMGTACNGLMHFPYALQLAYGMTKLPLTINAVLATGLVPLIIVLTFRYGATGSAAAWFGVNFTYVFLGTWLTHRVLLKGQGLAWLICDVGIPFVLTMLITFLGWRFFRVDNDVVFNLLLAGGVGMLAILANGLVLPKAALSELRQNGLEL